MSVTPIHIRMKPNEYKFQYTNGEREGGGEKKLDTRANINGEHIID